MAPISAASQTPSVATLPRLLAINKDFTDLNEQIRQATHIIGLPSNWDTIQSPQSRSEIIRHLVRARAEWVLRWILDKLKDEAELGVQARANPKAWKLLDWMIHVLPTSRSATHLRDAGVLTVLEKTLEENFAKDVAFPSVAAIKHADDRSIRSSESSETAQEEPKPSRKRKRPVSGTDAPLKKVALETQGLEQLFGAITTAVKSIMVKANAHRDDEDVVYTDHMKMALRTESAQAARILKHWLVAVQKLPNVVSKPTEIVSTDFLDLSLILEIWELRNVDADDDSGASAEQFSTECLVPTLGLYNKLQTFVKVPNQSQETTVALRTTVQDVERLLARHLFAPSRAAFFAEKTTEQAETKIRDAKLLASNLEPLRAKFLQAAQILDTSEPLPEVLVPLFRTGEQLLDMAIRFSPSRTPKTRTAERPWIQAVFVALAECVQCSLEAPEFPVSAIFLGSLEETLRVLVRHDITIDSGIIEDLFWFHSGVKFPLKHKREIHWVLIAALIELDSGLFLTRPKSAPAVSKDRPEDLTTFIFGHISRIDFAAAELADVDRKSPDLASSASHSRAPIEQKAILDSVILPIMSTYARNRDLLGFLRRWDIQLYESASSARSFVKVEENSIWQERSLTQALAEKLEDSLTQPQISDLFKQHLDRVKTLHKATKSKQSINDELSSKAFSSATILYAMIGSIQSDETTNTLQPQLLSLLKTYVSMVQHDWHRSNSRVDLCWKTLCQLLSVLWPELLHESTDMQASLLVPIVHQASKDVVATHKGQNEPPVDSQTRAAALMFLFTACDHLRTIPGQESVSQEGVRKALKSISASRLEPTDLGRVVEVFCDEYAHLLEHLEPDAREKATLNLLYGTLEVGEELAVKIAGALSEALFTFGSPALQAAYSVALLSILDQTDSSETLRTIVDNAFSLIHPSALSRDRREALLNKMTDILMIRPHNVHQLLSIMCLLMEVPNATAKICSDGSLIFDLAEKLQETESGLPLTLRLLQTLVQLTLGHVLPNKDQAQNKIFLGTLEKKLASATRKSARRSPARLAILHATFLAQREDAVLSTKQYVTHLVACLGDETVSSDYVVDALNEISPATLQGTGDAFDLAKESLRLWLQKKFPLDDMMCSDGGVFTGDAFIATEPTKNWTRLHTSLGKFGLYPSMKWFIDFSQRLLQERLTDSEEKTVMRSFADTITALDNQTKLSLVPQLTQSEDNTENQTASYRLLYVLVSALDDKHVDDVEKKQQQLAILPTLCDMVASSPNISIFNALLNSIDTILRDKPSLTTQHSIESTLSVLVKLAARNSPSLPSSSAPAIYARLCETSRLILLLHRGRLGGRFHLVLPLLQNLLFCLFIPNAGRGMPLPPWLKSAPQPVRLTPVNAVQYAKLLSTLCSPTNSSVQRLRHRDAKASAGNKTKSGLNDPVKAAKEYASHYVYPLLGAFCRFQLNGRLDVEVRKKLMVGIWETVGVAGMDRSALDAMFAGLDRATRDVWRGVWGEWVRVHGNPSREKKEFRAVES